MQVVILAGGKGERLRPLTESIPKPLIPINGVPLLDKLIHHAYQHGATSIIVCGGYLGNVLQAHINDATYPIPISVHIEDTPLGSAGPLKAIEDQLESKFIVMYGDVYTKVNLQKIVAFHHDHSALATLLLHSSDHPFDSTIAQVENDLVVRLIEKPGEQWETYGNLTNAALYVMNRDAISHIPPGSTDIARDLLPALLSTNKVVGYIDETYSKDIGTPQRYAEVQIFDSSLKPAVFLDRDGTIIEDVAWITSMEQISLLPYSVNAMKKINEHQIPIIIVTNQPVVAREMITEAELIALNDSFTAMLKHHGVSIDAVYYCPHHPETNHPEANDPVYRKVCVCRKPGTGMIEQATKKFKIDVENSFVVGDRTTDIEMGRRAGCTTILVTTGSAGKDNKSSAKPHYTVPSLQEAVDIIVQATQ